MAHAESTTSSGPGIQWPPPGLERLQGDLERIGGRAAVGGVLLVLPLLFVVGREFEFATLGPFADAWWLTQVLAVAGLAFSVDALIRTVTLLRRVGSALEQGYDLRTVMNVLADNDRDMGFLLTGARHFSVLSARQRGAIGGLRVLSASMYVLAGIWLPSTFAPGLLLGARGLVSPSGLWMVTLIPPLVLYAFWGMAKVGEEARIRRARRAWHGRAWTADLASEEALAWRGALASRSGRDAQGAARPSLGRKLRRYGVLIGALAALVALPILTLVPMSAVGPILAQMAVPSFDTFRARAARAEAMRSYVVAADPGVTPGEAGRLLHDLAYAGSDDEVSPGEREPSRRIAEPWVADEEASNPMSVPLVAWGDSIIQLVARGVSAEQRTYLATLAGHPARADFSRLARAGAIDIASGRYQDPLPESLSMATLPLPGLRGLRTGAHTHLGAAAHELLSARPERAEEMIREVVSVGFLLADGGTQLIDNAVGYALIDNGAAALEDFYEATRQEAKSAELSMVRAVAQRATDRAPFMQPQGTEAWVRSLPIMIADTSLARGLRWEYFVGITTLTPCLNVHRMVFGPDQAYQDFLLNAHGRLVMWPSEEPLFDLARRGWFGSATEEASWLGRLLSVSMRGGASTCAEIIRAVGTAQAF